MNNLSETTNSSSSAKKDDLQEKKDLLKKTFCAELSDRDLELFLHVCARTGLDPFTKQIFAIVRAGKMTIQTSIDGFRVIAERTGKYSPGKETDYTYDKENRLVSATAHIRKQTIDGSWHQVSATAFWKEYVQEYNGKPSKFWEKMPHVMLSKCAESLALRRAFPAELSAVYTEHEMSQSESNAAPEAEPIIEVEVSPKREPSTAFPYSKDIEGLKKYLQDQNIGEDLCHLDSYIDTLCINEVTRDKVIASATLNAALAKRFEMKFRECISLQ